MRLAAWRMVRFALLDPLPPIYRQQNDARLVNSVSSAPFAARDDAAARLPACLVVAVCGLCLAPATAETEMRLPAILTSLPAWQRTHRSAWSAVHQDSIVFSLATRQISQITSVKSQLDCVSH